MEFGSNSLIDEIYNSHIVLETESSEEYKNTLKEFITIYDSIEDEELKNKINKLEELKNKMYAQEDKKIFKMGFSIATKLIIEAINFKN